MESWALLTSGGFLGNLQTRGTPGQPGFGYYSDDENVGDMNQLMICLQDNQLGLLMSNRLNPAYYLTILRMKHILNTIGSGQEYSSSRC